MTWLAGVGAAPQTQYDVLRLVEPTAVHPSMASQAESGNIAEQEGEPCSTMSPHQVHMCSSTQLGSLLFAASLWDARLPTQDCRPAEPHRRAQLFPACKYACPALANLSYVAGHTLAEGRIMH